MKYIADLHIHSHYSLATSKELIPEFLDYWARIKGVTVIGTGDFTHRKWTAELLDKLEPAEPGMFKLKSGLRVKLPYEAPDTPVRFVLSAEISSIYKKNGKVRKVHNLLYAPDFETVEKIQKELSKIGNIDSDGRPILGLDSADLLKIAKSCSADVHFVPAHIWTPWFSVLGDKSGFDSVEACFGDLTDQITAVETGLSTDAPLNWMCSFLDRFTLISNSDAHSPDKLGRNANLLNTDLSYFELFNAIKDAHPEKFLGTIDLFPQEGKYHYDGHRKCNICWNPVETLRNRGLCTVCGKSVVIGVTNRIVELSDRTNVSQKPGKMPFHHIIPLPEILSEICGTGPDSKQVKQLYFKLMGMLNSEFDILLWKDLHEIHEKAGPVLAEAIRRMRNSEISIQEGFDGQYGVIKVFNPSEARLTEFDSFSKVAEPEGKYKRKLLNFDLNEYHQLKAQNYALVAPDEKQDKNSGDPLLNNLNPEQLHAVTDTGKSALVLAGPGTGKTSVLTTRIAWLIERCGADPKNIIALTFTNKAAGEMRVRLQKLLGVSKAKELFIGTFHAYGLKLITEHSEFFGSVAGFTVINEEEKELLMTDEPALGTNQVKKILTAISWAKQELNESIDFQEALFTELFSKYNQKLREFHLLDLDDLIYLPCLMLKKHPEIHKEMIGLNPVILIDEYQDINKIQFQFVKMLTGNIKPDIFAIGDPDQAIYGFRGANVEFIRSFSSDFEGTTTYNLKKSYRCSDRILQASSQLMGHDGENSLKGLNKGVKINLVPQNSDRSEGEWMARIITEMMGGLDFLAIDSGRASGESDSEIFSLGDFAILCRTRSLLDGYASLLKDKGIPYQVTGDEPLLRTEPLKTLVEIIRFACNHKTVFLRKKLEIRKIDPQKIPALETQSMEQYLLLLIERYFPIEKLNPLVEQFVLSAKSFGERKEDFLQFLNTAQEPDLWQPHVERVNLMTLHASKGLEFKCVFIPACEEGIIPYSLYKTHKSDIEEERRLLYVGMTRAEKYLYISWTMKRLIHGKEMQFPRSSFLDKIEKDLIEQIKTQKKKKTEGDIQLSLF